MEIKWHKFNFNIVKHHSDNPKCNEICCSVCIDIGYCLPILEEQLTPEINYYCNNFYDYNGDYYD
jgi:hypothetical protein